MLRVMNLDVAATPPEDVIPASWLSALLDHPGVPHAALLARRAGATDRSFTRWKTGKVALSRMRWLAILSAAGLPSDWVPPPDVPVADDA